MKTFNIKTVGKEILTAISFLVLVSGCNDALEIAPQSAVSPEKYLTDESHLAAYTVNYYSYSNSNKNTILLRSFDGPDGSNSGGESLYYDDIATDNATTRGSNNRFVPGLWTVGATGGDWNFKNIYAMNFYLNTVVPRFKAGGVTGNSTNIKHYIGEGYFLRAMDYFYRLRKYGDFPIIKEVLPDNQTILAEASKRSPRNEVARFILADLDSAILYMNDAPPGGKVRLTKKAALLVKSRVALFEASWEKYHAGTANVPNGTGWPGAAMDYNKNYQFPAGSAENEINYFLDQAISASALVADAVDLVPNNGVIRTASTQAVNQYYDMFATTNPNSYSEVLMYRAYDITYQTHSYNHYAYWGGGKGYTRQYADNFLMANGLPIYAPASGYAGDNYIQDTKVNRDGRWRLFMKAPQEIKAFMNITTPEKFETAPVIYSSDGKYSTSTGYILGKGYALDYNMQLLGKDVTAFIVFRAAEAYLNYIEASYLKTGTIDAKADGYWKKLRTRAGVDPDYTKTIAATDMSKEGLVDWGAYSKGQLVDATLYNIRRERRSEFIGEGFRYNDLLRWRAMDQLNGFQIEGCKVWGPMKADFAAGKLVSDQTDEKKNTVSSQSLSLYMRPYQVVQSNNNFYNGLKFCNAHYLEPIAVQHFLITATDGKTISTSTIYQNPGWPTEAGKGAIGF
ncbi:MAG: RagB/SusD family nutrient uptake outer membrane protein [Paludibacter sp.]|nr:RagB/SusD family nutrient uptake outer membrane protein [Paludibacter sp.]